MPLISTAFFSKLTTKEYPIQQERRNPTCTFNLYPIHQFKQLIVDYRNFIKENDIIEDDDEKNVFRYLVDTKGIIWFALEGTPARNIPSHHQMTTLSDNELCFSAGNIQINDQDEIININHKSGDYKPGFESLVHPLSILAAYHNKGVIKLAQDICIEKMLSSGGIEGMETLNLDSLINSTASLHIKEQTVQDVKEIKIIDSKEEERRAANRNRQPGKRRRGLFFLKDENVANTTAQASSSSSSSLASSSIFNPDSRKRKEVEDQLDDFHYDKKQKRQDTF